MTIASLFVSGYRSVRLLNVPLSGVNVLVGPNGCGKTNLYRSVYLLARAAEGRLGSAIMNEGGMPSVMWAGPRRKDKIRLRLAIRHELFNYRLALGLSTDRDPHSFFTLDPAIKEEQLELRIDGAARPITFLERKNRTARLRDAEGQWAPYQFALLESESVLSQLREPHRYPELAMVRSEFANWRFYHQFRTDAQSPLRHPRPATLTPVLDHDGYDLAATLATIIDQGRGVELEQAIHDAFPNSRLNFNQPDGSLAVQLEMQGIVRPFEARELSDGTLRYLCLVAALLSTRPASLIALNEPETSLHPDLIPPLARLITHAAANSQMWITTHSRALASAIAECSGQPPLELAMIDNETRLVNVDAQASPFEDLETADELAE